MKIIFSICAVLVVVCFPLMPVLSESVESTTLVVSGTHILSAQEAPYMFASVYVAPEGRLTIQPGVVVLVATEFVVDGFLEAIGTESKPITLSAPPGQQWRGIVITEVASPPHITHVRFANFFGPLQFYCHELRLSHIDLIDGVFNDVLVGRRDQTIGPVTLEWVRFLNYHQGKGMEESRITLAAKMGEVFINHVTFFSGRSFREVPWSNIGVSIPSGYRGLGLIDVTFPYRCKGIYKKLVLYVLVIVEANYKDCKEPVVPTLFVPGYGTSINLSVLTKQVKDVVPSQEGWRFIGFFTPAYLELERQFKDQGLPYEVAYYDWRLPASESAKRYLKPVIEAMKRKYNVPSIHVVAHSFGGIVSRAYVESAGYEGDIATIIELGTPNLGAAKAYPVWEGGELPDDWRVLMHLVRYYQYAFGKPSDLPVTTIRTFFPSVQEMLPLYPALVYNHAEVPIEDLKWRNTTVFSWRVASFLQSVPVTTYASSTEPTMKTLYLESRDRRRTLWPDGRVSSFQPFWNVEGDGTVPRVSVEIPGATNIEATGTHSNLPSTMAASVIGQLYGVARMPTVSPLLLDHWRLQTRTFVVDCPVTMSVTLPNGAKRSSTELDQQGKNQLGSVESSDDMLWMIMPDQVGSYQVEITALADTPVRFWVDDSEIESFSLKKGEQKTVIVQGAITKSTPSPQPTAVSVVKPEIKESASPKPIPETVNEHSEPPITRVLLPEFTSYDISYKAFALSVTAFPNPPSSEPVKSQILKITTTQPRQGDAKIPWRAVCGMSGIAISVGVLIWRKVVRKR